MMKNIRLKQRLILPIALLGLVALISNILSIFNIHNVNASAANIADNYMDGKSRLAEITQSSMDIHKMALSHIVATDYDTMITLVQQIKDEEARLDGMLAEYTPYVTSQDQAQYEALLSDYASFRHALVKLVCASASHKTQDAYALANGDVASCAAAMEADTDALDASLSDQTSRARARLFAAYLLSLIVSLAAILACAFLVLVDMKLINNYVVLPIQNILRTIQETSGHINAMTGEVLGRTQDSKGSAAGLSTLTEQLSATIQEVAGNVSLINDNTENVRQEVHSIVEECASITTYTVQMNTRAATLQQSAQDSAQTTRAKAEEILASLNSAIEKSKSVDQIKALTGEILAISQQETAGRIQAINDDVTAAVYNLSENAQHLIDYMNQSVLTQFKAFIQSGSQYKEDAAHIRRTMDQFQERTERLKDSMSGIADSIGTITKAIDEGVGGITGVADNTRSLADDMEDITRRMGQNQEIVKGLEKETVVFDNL